MVGDEGSVGEEVSCPVLDGVYIRAGGRRRRVGRRGGGRRESSVDGLCPGAVPISVQSVLTPPTDLEIDATRLSDLARIYARLPR